MRIPSAFPVTPALERVLPALDEAYSIAVSIMNDIARECVGVDRPDRRVVAALLYAGLNACAGVNMAKVMDTELNVYSALSPEELAAARECIKILADAFDLKPVKDN